MGALSFHCMEKLKIGFDDYWYKGDHDIIWAMGPFVGSWVWPIAWLLIGISKLAKKIIDKAADEIATDKEAQK